MPDVLATPWLETHAVAPPLRAVLPVELSRAHRLAPQFRGAGHSGGSVGPPGRAETGE